ncbi:MAG TPA: GreA/GreB family elongation factor [Thermoanaerobaculia bacterium]|nr:GreA/GreB family elongation factor [Thermoanaerobaculia bacterium]
MTNGIALGKLLSEQRYDEVESEFREALSDPVANQDLLLQAARGLARVPREKNRLQALAGVAEAELKPRASDARIALARWNLLKEAVRGGATPSTADGFHRLFEDAIGAAYPGHASLATLLGRFKFREAKTPAEGMLRMEKAEKWLPFEVGRCFTMPGRGPGKVVETNYALDSVRVDFEKVKGIAIPIGVAAKSLVPLPDGHFLSEKLKDAPGLRSIVLGDPAESLKWLLGSAGKSLTVSEVKDALYGLLSEEEWTSWWSAAKKHPQVTVNGSGKNATVEWSESAGAAEGALLTRFAKAPLKEKLDLFRKNVKRSPEVTAQLASALADEARKLAPSDPARAFEIAVLIERTGDAGVSTPDMVPDEPLPLLASLSDRVARERLLELFVAKRPADAPRVLSDWFFKEEDVRTIEAIDKRLAELDPAVRDWTLERLLKSPRQGPRAFLWYAQRAQSDETFRSRMNVQTFGRLLDAITWDELGAGRTKVREMFDRTGLAAIWLMRQASSEEARGFIEALARHQELEHHRRDALVAAAEMRFPELRKAEEETFLVTPEAIEAKRQELERIVKVEIPENTKGIALAAAEGDLSENFEYKARRDKQQLLSARAGKLQTDLGHARALDPRTVDTSEVRPGARVTLRGATERTVVLLGPWDSSPDAGIYSYLSEAAKALLGKRPGDEAEFLGERFTVAAIEPWR